MEPMEDVPLIVLGKSELEICASAARTLNCGEFMEI